MTDIAAAMTRQDIRRKCLMDIRQEHDCVQSAHDTIWRRLAIP
jgi:hypothetical protein